MVASESLGVRHQLTMRLRKGTNDLSPEVEQLETLSPDSAPHLLAGQVCLEVPDTARRRRRRKTLVEIPKWDNLLRLISKINTLINEGSVK